MFSKPVSRTGNKGWSISSRLMAWYFLSGICLVLISIGLLYWFFNDHVDHEVRYLLDRKVDAINVLLDSGPAGLAALQFEVRRPSLSRKFVRIIDGSGRVVSQSPEMEREFIIETLPVPADAQEVLFSEIRSRSGKRFRMIVARHQSGNANRKQYLIQIASDRSIDERFLAQYRARLLLALAPLLLIWVCIGRFLAYKGMMPVKKMAAEVRNIHSTTLSRRLSINDLPSELVVLSGTFNGMLDQIESAFARLSQFSADIAHELRTPLNSIRGEIEVSLRQPRPPEEYREVLGSCLEGCLHLSEMIDGLLFLARSEDPKTTVQRIPVNIGNELAIIRDFFDAIASEAGIEIRVTASDGLIVNLDRTLFQRAVGNLIENAIRHTAKGGAVAMTATADSSWLQLDVTDNGCGISAPHIKNIFDRFYRVDGARSAGLGGFGLGLPIVKSIATLHRGEVAVQSEVGKGTTVTLRFPCNV